MHLHGPGEQWNLIPVRQSTNKDMERVEQTVLPYVRQKGNILRYKTTVKSWHKLPPPASDDFPHKIEMKWGFLEAKRNGRARPHLAMTQTPTKKQAYQSPAKPSL